MFFPHTVTLIFQRKCPLHTENGLALSKALSKAKTKVKIWPAIPPRKPQVYSACKSQTLVEVKNQNIILYPWCNYIGYLSIRYFAFKHSYQPTHFVSINYWTWPDQSRKRSSSCRQSKKLLPVVWRTSSNDPDFVWWLIKKNIVNGPTFQP